ncbi:MAG: hypothetical protein ACE3JP_05985 [Ectobacillus sp.]
MEILIIAGVLCILLVLFARASSQTNRAQRQSSSYTYVDASGNDCFDSSGDGGCGGD